MGQTGWPISSSVLQFFMYTAFTSYPYCSPSSSVLLVPLANTRIRQSQRLQINRWPQTRSEERKRTEHSLLWTEENAIRFYIAFTAFSTTIVQTLERMMETNRSNYSVFHSGDFCETKVAMYCEFVLVMCLNPARCIISLILFRLVIVRLRLKRMNCEQVRE